MTSVIVAAHNEEAVIGACLAALNDQRDAAPIEVIVSANACSDETAELAREGRAIVVERAEPGKAAAINAAEVVASSFPRVYLDADIVVPPDGISRILGQFAATPAPLAVVPRRVVATKGRPWPVRAYFAINTRLPAFRHGLFGRGMIAVSKEGRARFDVFPTLIADDLFLDAQFDDGEKAQVDTVCVTVEAPFTTAELLARLVRVRRGNAQLRAASVEGSVEGRVRASDRSAWARVVMRRPWLAIHAVVYVWITFIVSRRARSDAATSWGRDESTRGRVGL